MDWVQFIDPVSHMCLAGTVAAPWSFTQEVISSNNLFKYNIFCMGSANSVKTFMANIKWALPSESRD